MAGSYVRRDIFDLIEVLRVVALRCVMDGVDKDKIIDLVDSLIQGELMGDEGLKFEEINDWGIMKKKALAAIDDLKI